MRGQRRFERSGLDPKV